MIKLGKSFWWVILLIGFSLLISRSPKISSNPLFLRLAIALIVVMLISGAWTAFSLWRISLNRSARTSRSQVGDVFIENFEIINHSVLPKLWIKISDQSKLVGGTGSRVLTEIRGNKSQAYAAYTLLQRRGWYLLGPTNISSGDLLGIFSITREYRSASRLLVIPYMIDLRFFLVPEGMLPGGHALREKTLEVTPYAAGIREYVPGDPLKRIHWPSSAKRQALFVKEFEKDPLAEVWLFIDSQKYIHIRSESTGFTDLNRIWWSRYKSVYRLPPDTFEYAITIAASLVKYYINEKREVGMISDGQTYHVLPAQRGERQLGKMLETLAVLEPEGELPVWSLVNSQLKNLVRGSTVVLITPSNNRTLENLVVDLLHRGLIPVIILLDLASFGGDTTSSGIAERLINLGVSTFVIREGDYLKAIFETNPVIN